ncbi:MAG: ABC transporter permease [Chloroflexota bacterium]
MIRELKFLLALWQANLLAAMEYRTSFVLQVAGMMLNNGVYFIFWVIFFDRFEDIGGWGLPDMFLIFGLVACSYGLAVMLFGNVLRLGDVIAGGQLDYYLSLPRPVLLHALASHSRFSGLGDVIYGTLSFFFAGQLSVAAFVRFGLGVAFSAVVFLSFLILTQSLAFWMGNAQLIGTQAINAIVTFSIYPARLFDQTARFLLFTIIPAMLVGAVPTAFVRAFSWEGLFLLGGASTLFLGLAIFIFRRGLRRYESGSAIQVQQ